MKYTKVVLPILFLASIAYATVTAAYTYKEAPDTSYVDNVHYDAKLKVIVIHVHARAWFINVNQIYGLRVKDDTDIENRIKQMIGEKPEIVRLEINK